MIELIKNLHTERNSKYERLTLTSVGEVIRLNEYCRRLANNENVHVVLFHDTNLSRQVVEE